MVRSIRLDDHKIVIACMVKVLDIHGASMRESTVVVAPRARIMNFRADDICVSMLTKCKNCTHVSIGTWKAVFYDL